MNISVVVLGNNRRDFLRCFSEGRIYDGSVQVQRDGSIFHIYSDFDTEMYNSSIKIILLDSVEEAFEISREENRVLFE